MINPQRLILAAAAMLLSAGSAMASGEDDIAFAREVDSCIAEVNDHADYNDATRVRHTVVEIKNTFAGYVLSIKTGVFIGSRDDAIREYLSYCVAKGDSKPKKFSIDKVSG